MKALAIVLVLVDIAVLSLNGYFGIRAYLGYDYLQAAYWLALETFMLWCLCADARRLSAVLRS